MTDNEGTRNMRATAIPYTHEDDVTPDADMAGLVMLHVVDDSGRDQYLDRIPEAAATTLVGLINNGHLVA